MSFLGEVLLRVLLVGSVFVGIAGATSSPDENVRGLCCIVIMLGSVLYTAIEFKVARSGK